MLRLRVVVIVVVVVLLLLLLPPLVPLLPIYLVKSIGIECRANQLVFVWYASTGIKIILLTKLIRW